MNCTELQTQLDDLIDGRLSSDVEGEIRTHAAGCDACRVAIERAEALSRALESLPVDPAAPGFEARILERVAAQANRQTRVLRGIGGGLIAACAASGLALAVLGPRVDTPSDSAAAGMPVVAMSIDEPRTVNLVFASTSAVDDVSLTVELPMGVEIAGYAGQSEVTWRTSMQVGKNYLPLELVARDSASGELVARVKHGDAEKVFRVLVTATG